MGVVAQEFSKLNSILPYSATVRTPVVTSVSTSSIHVPPPHPWSEQTKTTSTGEVRQNAKQTFYLLFQNSPIWLLALTCMEIEFLFVESLDRLRQRFLSDPLFSVVYSQIWPQLEHKIMEKKLEDVLACSSPLVLLSGNLDFVRSWSLRCAQALTLGLIDRYCKMRRSLPSGEGKWSQVSHSYVGGPTSFTSLWFQANFPVSLTLPKGMKRNIFHFIHHGVRGVPVSASRQSEFAPVTTLLSLSKVCDKYYYPTPASKTGFAARALDSSELGEMFGFPSAVTLSPSVIASSAPVPLDILRCIVTEALLSLGSVPVSRSPAPSLDFIPFKADPRGTFLPSINAWLPDSWASDTHVVTSVKHDDAKANVSLWNSRIILPLQSPSRSAAAIAKLIPLLRTFVSRYICRRIFREFMGCLRLAFPSKFRSYFKSRVEKYTLPAKWGHFYDNGGGVNCFLRTI